MATELETLIVTLEASTKQYERQLARAQSLTISQFRKMESDANGFQGRLSRAMGRAGGGAATAFGQAFKGALSALGLVNLVRSIVHEAERAVDRIHTLIGASRTLNMPVNKLQAWALAAREAGSSQEELINSLQTLQENLRDPGSWAAEFFKANHQAITGTAQDLETFANLINRLPAAQRQMAVQKATGVSSPFLTDVFAKGAGGLDSYFRKMMEEQKLLTGAQITAAEDARRKYEELRDKIDESLASVIKDADDIVNKFIDAWKNGDWSGLANFIIQLLNREVISGGGGTSGGSGAGGHLAGGAGADLLAGGGGPNMTAEERRLLGLIMQYESGGRNVPNFMFNPRNTAQGYYQITNKNWRSLAPGLGITAPNAMAASFDEQTKVALALLRGGLGIGNWSNFNPALKRALGSTTVQPASATTTTTGGGDTAVLPPDEAAKTYDKIVKGLTDERNALTMTARERSIYNTVTEASNQLAAQGVEITPEQTDALKKLAGQIYDTTQAQETMQQSMEEFGAALSGSVKGFVHDLLEGKSATEALRNALMNLAQSLIDSTIDQLFKSIFSPAGGGGIFSSLFSGAAPATAAFAQGGQFRVGGAGGTDSQFVGFRATPGEIVTVSPRRLASGRGAGGVAIGGTVINVAGSADERTVAMLDRRIAANNYRQRKQLEKDWGAMSARYQQLRG